MVNNYPEYAAGVSYQKAEENVKHFYNAQVKVDPSDDSLSALLTKDGTVIAELPDGGGGSSDFSTAEVTVVLAESVPVFPGVIPIAVDFIDPEYPEDNYSGISCSSDAESGVYKIPLYKGHTFLNLTNYGEDEIEITGNAELNVGLVLSSIDVYGDCTITINGYQDDNN